MEASDNLMEFAAESIQSITLILAVAGLIGLLFNVVRLPAVLAFILTGVVIGPGGLKWVANEEVIRHIAEIGIVFLLFVLGAELSLPRIKEMRIHSLWAGVLQLVITIIIMSLGFTLAGLDLKAAIFLGGALSLSSTALVLKILGDQNELDAAHGRIAMGILLVQDLALVPLMAFMPLLTGHGGEGQILQAFLVTTGKVLLFLAFIVLMSWRFVPRLADRFAAKASKEIFGLLAIAFGLLITMLAEWMGLSHAVGAFLAGLCLSQSLVSRQIVADLIPFRDVFSSVFFVSIGMLLNVPFLLGNLPLILLVTCVIVVVKLLGISLAVYFLRFPAKTIFWCAMSLFQVGEFSFILLQTGLQTGTLDGVLLNTVTSAIVLTMLLTPLAIRSIPSWLNYIESDGGWLKGLEKALPGGAMPPLKDEVIIAGYGPIAKNVAHVLQSHDIGFRVIEMNINTVKRLQNQGIHCVFGDSSNAEVLHAAGIQEAKVFAITIPDIRATELAIQNAKRLNPHIYCIVRTRYQHPIGALFQMGADEVVYEEFETSMSFIYSIIDVFGDTVSDKESYMLLLRENRKSLMNAGKAIEEQMRYGRFSVFKDTKIEWITIPEGSNLEGSTVADAALRQRTGVNILSILDEDGVTQLNPEPDTVLRSNQVLVVIGTLEQLTHLESLLC